ncbi:hypothetical protein N9N15_01090 [Flavobacteriaceae bacterium]|nr:hypothetical protein [Flavobacteriaceae bacterium]
MSSNSWPIFSYLSKYLNKYYLNSQTESDGTSLEYKATLNNIFMPIPQKEMDINENLIQRAGY